MKGLANIQAVTFDVGGTLLQPWPSVGHIYAEVAGRHGVTPARPELLNRRFAAAWRKLGAFNHSPEEWAALVDETFLGIVEVPPSQSFFPEIYDRFREPDAWRIFDDALPTLHALSDFDLRLGIVSNWDDRLGPLLERLGLSKYFEAILISCDVGFAKPSPVIFEQASKKLGVAPPLVLHVGDSPERDVAGARSAGFESILLKRSQDGEAAESIGSLLEMERLLQPGPR